MKISVECSSWNNIGNAWFQISLFNLLKSMYPQHEVLVEDSHPQGAFRVYNAKQRANALRTMDYTRADLHVYVGPMVDQLPGHYRKAVENLFARGEKYCVISASCTGASPAKVAAIGEFLRKYPPLFFATRDEETYLAFKDYVPVAYNGICTAMLVGRTVPVAEIQLEKPFFISSFYTELEPTFSVPDGEEATVENIGVEHHPTLWGLPYNIARHLNFTRPGQEEVGGKYIVRTVQNLNTRFNHINFAMPHSFISFNPVAYLSVVKSSEFTISDRVHACVVSLAMNHPARFLFSTPRAGIFDRMGFDYKSHGGIMYPNMDKVDEEMYLLQKQLVKYISDSPVFS